MLNIIDPGTKMVIVSFVIFFFVLWYLCAMWAKAHPNHYPLVGLFVSSLFSFKFLIRTFLIILLFSILWYLKDYYGYWFQPLFP